MVGVEFLIGGWFASPVIKSVLEKAQKYLAANYKWQKGAQEMVEELTGTLLICQATVEEVDKKVIINNQALADWLRMLKETVYEAEDVLDTIETKSIKDEVEGNTKNQVIKLASYSRSVVRNMVLSEKNHKSLEKVVDKLNKISTQIQTILELVNMNENKKSQAREDTNPRETISESLEEVGLYGREDELNLILEIVLCSPSKSILEKILGSQSKFFFEKILGWQSKSSKKREQNDNYHGIFVIPIVGMGGVGKTALAQAVYNNHEVQHTFAKRAWTSVSNNRDVLLVMGKIYESIKEYPVSDLANRSLESISVELSSIIKGVKFLIVLDDMFESDHWDFIHKTLSRGAPGSVVLITTQNHVFANRIVANTVGAIGPIALSALDLGKFWELFEQFAFGNVVMSEEKRIILKSIGKKIADKLHGLPLAAKIIGNVLRSNMDEDSWRDISKSEWWDIPEGQSQILPSVGLGYEQLNPCLRQCFAYCSLFPRNSLIEKDRLVHMWIAQNFIQSDVKVVKRLEDIGRQWFDELVKKSFFQRAWDNNSYVMHDLMHDLAIIVSSGECFYLGEGVVEIPSGVRHLAVDTNNLQAIKGIQKHKNLRSLLYYGCSGVKGFYSAINRILFNLDSIRVLDLSYMPMEYNYKPPPAIWNLQHLRFLDLSSTGISVLTYSSIDLYHLQALYIQKCQIRELPRSINKLLNLHHLYADEETIAQISFIGKLTNLQELGTFVVGKKEGHKITELRYLREIRGTLRIKNFEKITNKEEAMIANTFDKKHLHSICICASTIERKFNVDMEVLEELRPHKDIKDLRIDNYVGSDFPNWIIQIGDFQNLNTVFLVSCVNVKFLPPLGELPALKHLQIKNIGSVKLIDCHLYGQKQTVFPLLEELVLKTLSNCEEWTDDGRGREFFPRLSKLTIINNKKLRETPLHLFSPSLKELTIDGYCNSLTSLETSIPLLSSLTHLKLCNTTISVSLAPVNMQLLEDLNLKNCPELKIKGYLQSLTHLKRMKLVSCSKLFNQYSTMDPQIETSLQVHWEEGLRSLTHIEADHSLLYHDYYLILGSLPSLRVMQFKNSKCTRFTDHQILWFRELTALQEIYFFKCELEHLPASLTLLSSLKKMTLTECTLRESLSDSMPPNLQELYLWGNSQNLVQLCEANKGRDQQFISSIPVIHIDYTTLRHQRRIPDAHRMQSMEIRKPSSDAIGPRACASCGKTFEQRDWELHDWKYSW